MNIRFFFFNLFLKKEKTLTSLQIIGVGYGGGVGQPSSSENKIKNLNTCCHIQT